MTAFNINIVSDIICPFVCYFPSPEITLLCRILTCLTVLSRQEAA